MTESLEQLNSLKYLETTTYTSINIINQEEYFYQIHKAQQAMIDPKYKTELCKSFIAKGMCRYKYKCRFAHGVSDLMKKGNDNVINKGNLTNKLKIMNDQNINYNLRQESNSVNDNNTKCGIVNNSNNITCVTAKFEENLNSEIHCNNSVCEKEKHRLSINGKLDFNIDVKDETKFKNDYFRQDSSRTSTTTNYASTKLNISGDSNDADIDSMKVMQDMFFLLNLTDSTKKYRRLRLFERMTDGSMS